MWTSLISIKEKEKNELKGWFWVKKLTLNYPSLMNVWWITGMSFNFLFGNDNFFRPKQIPS